MTARPIGRATFGIVGAVSLVMVALVVVVVLYFGDQWTLDRSEASGGGRATTQEPRKFVLHEAPQPLPAIGFKDESGQAVTLADFRGKTVLLNIWATWCLPCREEMPALDALEAKLGGAGFEVLALSIDRAGAVVVREFFTEVGIEHLGLYIDASMQASIALAVVGVPTTLLIDAEGRELGRVIGPAEWDSPEMTAFLGNYVTAN